MTQDYVSSHHSTRVGAASQLAGASTPCSMLKIMQQRRVRISQPRREVFVVQTHQARLPSSGCMPLDRCGRKPHAIWWRIGFGRSIRVWFGLVLAFFMLLLPFFLCFAHARRTFAKDFRAVEPLLRTWIWLRDMMDVASVWIGLIFLVWRIRQLWNPSY